MKIVVLQGSPNINGSTAILVEEFARGAREAGHAVVRIDVDRADVAPCTGCVRCGYEGPCIQHDGMDGIRNEILSADMVVFATPLYYYGMTAQLKIVIDRFCSARAAASSARCSPWHGTPTIGRSMRWRRITRRSCATWTCATAA